MQIKGVLFDLDGTLIDTAVEFWHIANTMRQELNLPALDFTQFKQVFSHGGPGLYETMFALPSHHPQLAVLKTQSHLLYKDSCGQHASLYPGMEELLHYLELRSIPWGIVTNKTMLLTKPLLEKLKLANRLSTLVCADSTPFIKPHPAPVLKALEDLQLPGKEVVFIGDAKRDIDAGKAAGTYTIAAGFGYLLTNDDILSWQADHIVNDPRDLLKLMQPWL